VTPPSAPAGVALLLGRDHEEYGSASFLAVSANTVAAISAGSDVEFLKQSPAKYDVNEDALLAFENDRHTVLCVADAHFGGKSAALLVTALAEALVPVPQNPAELNDILREFASRRPEGTEESATTLLVCIHDRMFKQTFGVSFGDSSLVHVNAAGKAVLVNEKAPDFVALTNPASLHPDRAHTFAVSPKSGDLLIVYTDGIDECCYRDPDRSITLEILAETVRASGGEPVDVTEALTRLALAGVAGHPGGQDNLALIVTRA